MKKVNSEGRKPTLSVIVKIIGFVLLTAIATAGIYGYIVNNRAKDRAIVENETIKSSPIEINEDTVVVVMDVLEALNYYNLSTKSLSNPDDVLLFMRGLLDAQKYMEQGDRLVERYSKSPNEFISITALGMITGSKMVQRSTENLVQYLRTVDEDDSSTYSDIQYQVAKYLSDNKEGFMLIAQSAPQVTALLWEPAKSENPSGPIPYKITKRERQSILDRINELFGEDLEEYYLSTDNYNSMIFAVDSIKKNIVFDTYEESAKSR